MTVHTIGYTYAFKEDAVRLGQCRQTTRRESKTRPRFPGDEGIHHGWTGAPYRSPWSWRLRAPFTEVLRFEADTTGLLQKTHECLDLETGRRVDRPVVYDAKQPWDSYFADLLARLDWIRPATGLEFRDVLKRLGTLGEEPIRLEVLRW